MAEKLPYTPSFSFTEASVETLARGVWNDVARIHRSLNNIADGSSPIDHGSLDGLGDDDHPQYAEVAAVETISARWTFTQQTTFTAQVKTDTLWIDSSTADSYVDGNLRFTTNHDGLYFDDQYGGIPPTDGTYRLYHSGGNLNLTTTVDRAVLGINNQFTMGTSSRPIDLYVYGDINATGTITAQDQGSGGGDGPTESGINLYGEDDGAGVVNLFSHNNSGNKVQITKGTSINGAAIDAIAESQITDGSILARLASAETITGAWTHTGKLTAQTGDGWEAPLTIKQQGSTSNRLELGYYVGDFYFQLEGSDAPIIIANTAYDTVAYFDTANARLGVGRSPTYEIDVLGRARVSEEAAFGSTASPNAARVLNVISRSSVGHDTGLYITAENQGITLAHGAQVISSFKGTSNGQSSVGVLSRASWDDTQTLSTSTLTGLAAQVRDTVSGGGCGSAYASAASVSLSAGASITSTYAYHASTATSHASSAITTAYGLYVAPPSATAGSIGAFYGVRVGNVAAASSSTYSPLLVDAHTGNSASQGNIQLLGGNWNNGHIQLGGAHIWFDGTNLRAKTSAPTSATDGTILV